jgi:hypothetical protein
MDSSLDDKLMRLATLAKDGDLDAAYLLHAEIAIRIRGGRVTTYLAEFIASMHEALASGEDVESAVMMAAPAHRPRKNIRDARVFDFVHMMFDHTQAVGGSNGESAKREVNTKRPPMAAIYALAAKIFGVSPSIAKAIYLREKKNRGIVESD